MFMRLTMLAAAACSVLATAAPALANQSWDTTPYDHNGVLINAKEITLASGGKLWFKLEVVNNSEKTLVVNPDQVQVKTPDGKVTTRSKGAFDKLTRGTASVAPHAGTPLNVEFVVGNPPSAELLLYGFSLDGSPLKLPPLVAKPHDRDWTAAPYAHNGLRFNVKSARPSGKDKFEIKMTVTNDSEEWYGFDRNKTQARLSDGTLAAREKGFMDKNFLVTLKPHSSEEVELEYKVGAPASVAVLPAVFANGAQVQLPELVFTP